MREKLLFHGTRANQYKNDVRTIEITVKGKNFSSARHFETSFTGKKSLENRKEKKLIMKFAYSYIWGLFYEELYLHY
jgi:hypothetical protein